MQFYYTFDVDETYDAYETRKRTVTKSVEYEPTKEDLAYALADCIVYKWHLTGEPQKIAIENLQKIIIDESLIPTMGMQYYDELWKWFESPAYELVDNFNGKSAVLGRK